MLGKEYLENASKKVDELCNANDTKSLASFFDTIIKDYEESCKRDAALMQKLHDDIMRPITMNEFYV